MKPNTFIVKPIYISICNTFAKKLVLAELFDKYNKLSIC